MALLQQGQAAPTFELPASDGRVYRLDELRGKPVVLYFYPKADTPGCTIEACGFRDRIADYQKLAVPVFGVSPDSVEEVTSFAKKFNLNFPLLADVDHSVCELYGVWQEKNRLGIVSWGTARTTYIIDSQGKIARVFEAVKPAGHEAEVLEALKSVK